MLAVDEDVPGIGVIAPTRPVADAFLAAFKADKDAIEDRAIETLTRLDEVKAQLEELQSSRVELVKLRDLEEAQRDAKALEVKDRLDELELKRTEAASEIPTDVLADYDSLVAAAKFDDKSDPPFTDLQRFVSLARVAVEHVAGKDSAYPDDGDCLRFRHRRFLVA